MRQIITRVDEELAEALKERAAEAGQSVNSYVTGLLRAAVAGPSSPRRTWKAAAMANGLVLSRSDPAEGPASWDLHLDTGVTTPGGYAAGLVSSERDER